MKVKGMTVQRLTSILQTYCHEGGSLDEVEIYDKEGNAVAVISEYSTGKESFQSPEVQEKFIMKCISKVIEMRL